MRMHRFFWSYVLLKAGRNTGEEGFLLLCKLFFRHAKDIYYNDDSHDLVNDRKY